MSYLLKKIAKLSILHPRKIIFSFFVLFILGIILTGRIKIDTDFFSLFPKEEGPLKVLAENIKDMGAFNHIYFLLEAKQDKNSSYLIKKGEQFVSMLKEIKINGKSPFTQIRYKRTDFANKKSFSLWAYIFFRHPERFIEKNDIKWIKRKLTSHAIKKELLIDKRLLTTPFSLRIKDFIKIDPLGFTKVIKRRVETTSFFLSDKKNDYFLSNNGDMMLIQTAINIPPYDMATLRRLLSHIKNIEVKLKDIKIGITGGASIAAAQEKVIKRDILITITTSLLGILLLFFFAYRRWITLFFIGFPLIIGLHLTLGVAYLLFGKLNILAAGFGAILMGLGVDFAIHLYDRFHSERAYGKTSEEALIISLTKTGSGVITAGLTTIAAFLTITISDVRGIQEFGFMVAIGVFFCLLTIIFVLPSSLIILDRHHEKKRGKAYIESIYHPLKVLKPIYIASLIRFHHRLVILFFIIISIIMGYFSLHVKWEKDFRNLRPKEIDPYQVYEKLIHNFRGGYEQAYFVIKAKNMDDLLSREEKVISQLKKLKSKNDIFSYFSFSSILNSKEKANKIKRMLLEEIDFKKAKEDFINEANNLGFSVIYFDHFLKFFDNIYNNYDDFWEIMDKKETKELLSPFLVKKGTEVKSVITILYKGGEVYSKKLESALTGFNGKITGMDFVNNQIDRMVKKDITKFMILAFLGVIFLIVIHFRRLFPVLLSFVPLFTGILWMMGLLGIIGMKINIFNSMVFPLILGIGIDDGILILTRFRETGNNDWETPLLFTGRAITMTSLTTMIAFGSLISASYPILSSIGFIILFGVGFCLLTSLFLLPSLLKEFVNVRNKKIESR